MTRINLNERIKVRLTDLGKDIYYHQFDYLNERAGRCVCKPEYPKIDEDGYTEFQLWVFIELYGKHIGIAKPNVIYPNEIVCVEEPTIEVEPIKHGHWVAMNADGRGYADAFGCTNCSCVTKCGYFTKGCDYEWCPWCGAKMDEVKSDIDENWYSDEYRRIGEDERDEVE